MNVIIINEINHGCLGVALNYYNSVKWLINNYWINDDTDVCNPYDDDNIDHWVTVHSVLGDNWRDIMLNEWDIKTFNDFFLDFFELVSIPVIGSEDD